jgi:division protein CdvB (Snf7/Vps24/ESCRT-III family)
MDFFKSTTVKEEARNTKREVSKTQRELDREKVKFEQEEKKLIAEIQKLAKNGGSGGSGQIKILAKQLVQVRNAKSKIMTMNSNLGAVKTKVTVAAATETMAQSLKSTTGAMKKANKAMDTAKLSKTMQQFAVESEKMGLNEEMMDMTLSALDDDVEEDADAITKQVLDEIGVNLSGELHAAPTNALGTKQAIGSTSAAEREALES